VFGRAALERALSGGDPLEGCDDFSPINVQKSVGLSNLTAAACGRRFFIAEAGWGLNERSRPGTAVANGCFRAR